MANVVKREGFEIEKLFDTLTKATKNVKDKLEIMSGEKDTVSMTDMFDMQILMNHLGQLSEMSASLISASNSAIGSFARGLKQ